MTEYTKEYWIRKNRESKILNLTGKQPSFLDWMMQRYGTSPILQRDLCKRTARYGSGHHEFEACMEWYRRRYRYEMDLSEQLNKQNPFKEEK